MSILKDKTKLGINMDLYKRVYDNYKDFSNKVTFEKALESYCMGKTIICEKQYCACIYDPSYDISGEHTFEYNLLDSLTEAYNKTSPQINDFLYCQWYVLNEKKLGKQLEG